MKKILIVLIVLCGLFSCTNYLNVKPSNVMAIVNYDEVKALLGAHLRMFAKPDADVLKETTVPYYNTKFWTFFHMYSDDINPETFINSFYFKNLENMYIEAVDWKSTDKPGEIWKAYYKNIGFYNTILDELGNVECTQSQYDIVACETKVLRAWHLFKLIQYFSPYKLNKYGLPINLDAQKVGVYDASRRTQSEMYEIITSELKECLAAKTDPRPSYNVFYDKQIINALLAQVYLYKGDSGAKEETDYANAIIYAKAALEGEKLQGLSEYAPFPSFPQVEGVHKNFPQALYIDFRSDSEYTGIVGQYDGYGDKSKQYASESLYRLFEDNDIRKSAFFDENKAIKKYLYVKNEYYMADVFQYWSVAELYLIVAESYIRSGDETEAKKWLEEFQSHRYMDYKGCKGDNLLQEILDERRREFCFEYDMRWCDCARLQKGWSRPGYGESLGSECVLEDGDYRFALPIPVLEELQYNDIEQNPGWLIKEEHRKY